MLRGNLQVVAIAALSLFGSSAAFAAPVNFTKVFVFGDSLSDVGNVYAISKLKIEDNTGILYDDRAKFPGPTPPAQSGNILVNAGLLSNYNYTVGRFTNGTDSRPPSNIKGVWNEVLAGKLNLAVPTNSLAGGTNYAYGGAETKDGTTIIPNVRQLNTTKVTASADVNNVGEQVAKFKTSLGVNNADDKALYIVWGGGNDVINTADVVIKNNTDPVAITTAAKDAVENLKKNVKKLYDMGARNILWPNLPPMEKIPYFAGKPQAVLDKLSDASKTFKTDETAAITALMAANNGLSITPLDVLGLFNTLLQSPGDYGYTNVDKAVQCLVNENPDKYVFWDKIHPTSRTHQLLGEAAFAALVPEPMSISIILILPMLIVRQRRAA